MQFYVVGGNILTTQDQIMQSGAEGAPTYPHFVISQEYAVQNNMALPLMIVDRMGYLDKQRLEEDPTATSDIQPLIDMIVASSSKQSDYLLPDTPLKEALFRLMLARGNEPMTADEISRDLSERWSMSAYPRNLTPHVINRMLENSGNYCIVRVED